MQLEPELLSFKQNLSNSLEVTPIEIPDISQERKLKEIEEKVKHHLENPDQTKSLFLV